VGCAALQEENLGHVRGGGAAILVILGGKFYVVSRMKGLKSGYKRSTLQQTIAFILSKACCLMSVHWNGTSLDV
jgi:hypothetical protein